MIPGFTNKEIDVIRALLTQHYQQDVEIHLADSEVPLLDNDVDMTSCPTVFWYQRGANFVVVKVATSAYRTQFFYTPLEQFGTDIDEYTDLKKCVAAVLQVQSDHAREGVRSGTTGDPLN